MHHFKTPYGSWVLVSLKTNSWFACFLIVIIIFCKIDFNEVDADIYSNDLKSLRTIVNAFSKDYDVQWDVVSASLSAGSCPVETDKYAELIKYVVKAVGWSQ